MNSSPQLAMPKPNCYTPVGMPCREQKPVSQYWRDLKMPYRRSKDGRDRKSLPCEKKNCGLVGLGRQNEAAAAWEGSSVGEESSAPVCMEPWVLAGEEGVALENIPYLRNKDRPFVRCPVYHAAHVPYVDAIRPTYFQ